MARMNSMPTVWGDLGLAGQNQEQLSEQDDILRKKKIMAAGGTNLMTAVQTFFGQRQAAGNTGIGLGS